MKKLAFNFVRKSTYFQSMFRGPTIFSRRKIILLHSACILSKIITDHIHSTSEGYVYTRWLSFCSRGGGGGRRGSSLSHNAPGQVGRRPLPSRHKVRWKELHPQQDWSVSKLQPMLGRGSRPPLAKVPPPPTPTTGKGRGMVDMPRSVNNNGLSCFVHIW